MFPKAKYSIASRIFLGLAILNLFTFVICIAAIYSFRDSGHKIDLVTSTLLPQIIVAADLGNQSSNLSSRSAELIAADSLLELDTVILRLGDQIDAVSRIEKKLALSKVSNDVLLELKDIRSSLDNNLAVLMTLVKKNILLRNDITKHIELIKVINNYSDSHIRDALLTFTSKSSNEGSALNSELNSLFSDWSKLSNQALLNIATTSETRHPIQLIRQESKFQQHNIERLKRQSQLLHHIPNLKDNFLYLDRLFTQIESIYKLRKDLFKNVSATQGVLTIHTHLSDVLIDFTSKLSTEFESKALAISGDIHDQFSRRTLIFLLGLALFFAVAGAVFYYVDHYVVSRIQRLTRRIQNQGTAISSDAQPISGDEISEIDASLTYFISEIEAREALLENERGKAINATQSKSRLLAAASHDLRQPLHAIVLMLSGLKDHVEGKTGNKILGDINQSVTDLSNMFDSILDLSHAENSNKELENSHFKIQTILERIEQEFRPLAIKKRIRLIIPQSDITIFAHRESIHRILANLVSNGIKYTQIGGVTLLIKKRAKDISISVFDTGTGIPKDERNQVFKENYQASKHQEGHGLGLAIAQELALKMGTEITLSETPTKSALFQISIPKGEVQLIKNAPQPTSGVQITSLKGLAVVLVEDEQHIRLACRNLLENWGCHVTMFSNYHDALLYIEQENHTFVLITDLHLGRSQNGIKLAEVLSAKKGSEDSHIIITSASQFTKESIHENFKFLRKPFSPSQLATTLRGFVRKSA
ncbi:MAG: ATP-binding protein [Oceanospirillaceae bacterium]